MGASVLGLDATDYAIAVKSLSVGKRLPNAVYVHRDVRSCRAAPLGLLLDRVSRLHEIPPEDFNVVKFRTDAPRLSFLAYSNFYDDPHPTLMRAIAVDLATGKKYSTDYSDNHNPPILHRKELLLDPTHERYAEYAALSAAEEAAGLFQNSAIIGFRANWERLLLELGIQIDGHELRRVKTCSPLVDLASGVAVQRHKTAITRYGLSKPVKTLLEHGQIRPGEIFFDYGCGHGADVRGLRELGFTTCGWDPVHAPEVKIPEADVVNLGYVLNVIEDPAERLETLVDAWRRTRRLLVISALICSSGSGLKSQTYSDGVFTSRGTFQKYFTQQELRQYIEDALETNTAAVALGVFYAFRRPEECQSFLQYRTRRVVDWENLGLQFERPQRLPKTRHLQGQSKYEKNSARLEDYWSVVLSLGRLPDAAEFDRFDELSATCGSPKRALRILLARGRDDAFQEARARHKNDLLVYLAAANLKSKIPFSHLPSSARTDIRDFFGTYERGLKEGLQLLRSAAEPNTITLACDDASVGWQDAGGLDIETSLLQRLPPVLRAYVACAELLYGDASQAHIIKIHKRNPKVTFLEYDNFESAALPELMFRTKVNLGTSSIEVFDHRAQGQRLIFKERFLAPEHPARDALSVVSAHLRAAGLSDSEFFTRADSALLEACRRFEGSTIQADAVGCE